MVINGLKGGQLSANPQVVLPAVPPRRGRVGSPAAARVFGDIPVGSYTDRPHGPRRLHGRSSCSQAYDEPLDVL